MPRKAAVCGSRPFRMRAFWRAFACASALALASCGGGGGGGSSGGATGSGVTPPVIVHPTASEAGRLLTQATFGPTATDISALQASTVNDWIVAQLAAPLPTTTHEQHINDRIVALAAQTPPATVDSTTFYESWWGQAITSPDQLRQRTAFALSQIFVISLVDPTVDVRGAASYYDMLNRDAFGNFRTLLDDVTRHPMMGRYLTFLGNIKEAADGSRTPDENYAREVMQLMTIGLFMLNTDGTQQKDSSGNTIATYTTADIQGLAKVFTGLSWYSNAPTNTTFAGGNAHTDRSVRPMIDYPAFHSTSAKTFLGVTIPATTTATNATMDAELKTALDTLFNHPNVGPFISYRLIQQMVTSNPSPAYVGRVAAVFNNNGSGVRGDMAAVIKAILTDTEARDATTAAGPGYGKLREPVVRLANWARAFGATSQGGNWLVGSTSANTSLSQSPLTSGSVFNFWRPGFTPASLTELGSRSLVAPEMQVVDEVSTAAWVNNAQSVVQSGVGSTPPGGTGRDVQASYTAELGIADTPSALADRMNLVLLYGGMSQSLRDNIVQGTTAIAIPAATGSNQAAIDTAKRNRVNLAVFLTMISPEYLAQR